MYLFFRGITQKTTKHRHKTSIKENIFADNLYIWLNLMKKRLFITFVFLLRNNNHYKGALNCDYIRFLVRGFTKSGNNWISNFMFYIWAHAMLSAFSGNNHKRNSILQVSNSPFLTVLMQKICLNITICEHV